ncbi:MAG: hypothetical protein C4317_08960 [Acidimicrobiia bacterium]
MEAAAAQLQEKTGGIDWAIAGPSIGPCCYRVEKDRLDLFEERFGRNCVDRNRSSLDMHAAVVRALESRNRRPLGVISLGPCTACSDQLYSYRRDGPRTGRLDRRGETERREVKILGHGSYVFLAQHSRASDRRTCCCPGSHRGRCFSRWKETGRDKTSRSNKREKAGRNQGRLGAGGC